MLKYFSYIQMTTYMKLCTPQVDKHQHYDLGFIGVTNTYRDHFAVTQTKGCTTSDMSFYP